MSQLLESKLYVFSTQRLVSKFYDDKPDGILPKAMSISDFFSHCYVVPDKTHISDTTQKIILHHIISEMPSITNLFVFEKSFRGYLESSSFLITLFREVASHNIDFTQIPTKDIYADYAEHLAILEEIYTRFLQKLSSYGFYSIPKFDEIKILEGFVASFAQIELHIDGFLNPLEIFILEHIAKITTLTLHINIDTYNKNHFKWLHSESLQPNHSYIIDFASKTIVFSKPTPLKTEKMQAIGFQMRISQCAFVLERINILLSNGIDPQKIAIITPDEQYALFLQTLDTARNCNYAMGKSIIDSAWFKDIETLLATKTHANNLTSLRHILTSIAHTIPTNIESKIQELLYQYEQIPNEIESFMWEDFVELFKEDVRKFSLDDVNGGKIRVMGILETRGLGIEYAIVVDFNASFVPKIRDSDMFLNTKIRENLGMPTLKDRQDLQKHYYYQLFLYAQKVDLVCCVNEENIPANMIDELHLKLCNGDKSYALFEPCALQGYKEEKIIGKIPLDFTFSATSLTTFLECKRRFYYHYMLKLEPQQETMLEQNIGIKIHQALKDAFSPYINQPLTTQILQDIKQTFFRHITLESKTQEFMYEISKLEMTGFWQSELHRAQSGLCIQECEGEHKATINNRKLYGKFDRVDLLDSRYWILDYKYKTKAKVSKDVAKNQNIQLAFYKLLLYENLGHKIPLENISIGLYYLRDTKESSALSELSEEDFLESQKLIFDTIQESMEDIEFELADKNKCRYCQFIGLCNRY